MSSEAKNDPGYSILADLEKPFSAQQAFGNDKPVELEIGAGRGDFAVGYCESHPDINVLAVERKLNYLMRGVNKARQRNLSNICFLNVEIQHFLEEYIPDESLQAVHIYFPDPWPKKRHLKRRIVQMRLMKALSEKLMSGGKLYLRTDHGHYFEHMMEVMGVQRWFTAVDTPEAVSCHQTGFEKRFRAEGLPIYCQAYELTAKGTFSQ